jgi:ankyrin repeat protein
VGGAATTAAGSADDVEELLVRHGVEVNATDHLGNTALHYAAGAGHLAAVLALLARPSLRLNATNNVGDTPLHKASSLPPSPFSPFVGWLAGLAGLLPHHPRM